MFFAAGARRKAGTSASFTVSPAALAGFLVQDTSGNPIGIQTAGTAFNIKLTAIDAFKATIAAFVINTGQSRVSTA